MKIASLVAVVAFAAVGCARSQGLVVTHTPNPCDVHDVKIPEGKPYPYMWFYKTEVRNDTETPIRITKFEGFFYRDSEWKPSNILNRELGPKDFSEWYIQGDAVKDGWIQPHGRAVCDPNWHGVDTPVSPRCKWTYDGVDAQGKAYHAEAEVEAVPVKPK